MDLEHRRLLARAVKSEEDAQLLRERLAACYREVEEVRAKVPAAIRQVDFRPPSATTSSDPIVRLFAALAPPR